MKNQSFETIAGKLYKYLNKSNKDADVKKRSVILKKQQTGKPNYDYMNLMLGKTEDEQNYLDLKEEHDENAYPKYEQMLNKTEVQNYEKHGWFNKIFGFGDTWWSTKLKDITLSTTKNCSDNIRTALSALAREANLTKEFIVYIHSFRIKLTHYQLITPKKFFIVLYSLLKIVLIIANL